MSINKAIISGNLTRDPELRQTQSGMAVLGFGVAVNDRRKNQQTGEWEDYPNFIDCTMFGKRAESISPYLTKGTKVSVEGKLRWTQWDDKKSGGKRSKVEIVVDEIEFMSSRDKQPAQPAPAPAYGAPQYAAQPQQYAPQQGYAPQQAPAQYAPQPVQQAPTYGQPVQAPMPEQMLYDEDIPF